MIDFRLYLVTDRHVLRSGSLEDAVDRACSAGVRAVQLREKDIDAKSLHYLAGGLRRITAAHGASFFVNDRADIAVAVGADGVHCPENGFPPAIVRRVVGRGELVRAEGAVGRRVFVGASTHSLERAADAQRSGADFITFGPVFETASKKKYGPPLGLEMLRRVSSNVTIPVFAIGGISPERAVQCIDHGARGVAVVSGVLASENIERAVRDFEAALGTL